MPEYKFNLRDKIRVRGTRLKGEIRGRHTSIVGCDNNKEILVRYTVILDTLGRSQLLWYEEDCLTHLVELKPKERRKLLVHTNKEQPCTKLKNT